MLFEKLMKKHKETQEQVSRRWIESMLVVFIYKKHIKNNTEKKIERSRYFFKKKKSEL